MHRNTGSYGVYCVLTDGIDCDKTRLYIASVNDEALHPCWLKMSSAWYHPLQQLMCVCELVLKFCHNLHT